MFGRFVFAAALALAAIPGAASAQTAPISKTISLTYTGTVTNAAADTIMVRQPDGTMAHYTGPLPNLPYANGDQVTISFNATVPTKAFYDSGLYTG
jgi:polyisoprenoid-binding protein YceI